MNDDLEMIQECARWQADAEVIRVAGQLSADARYLGQTLTGLADRLDKAMEMESRISMGSSIGGRAAMAVRVADVSVNSLGVIQRAGQEVDRLCALLHAAKDERARVTALLVALEPHLIRVPECPMCGVRDNREDDGARLCVCGHRFVEVDR